MKMIICIFTGMKDIHNIFLSEKQSKIIDDVYIYTYT